MEKLLTRDEFRESVFKRDNFKCVFCSLPAVDAHHIMERRLWKDGGYYLSNGASVCEEHHILCEQTKISLEEIREKCGILKPIIPEHLYDDQKYDKWGNVILEDGRRLKGELFNDESVQKILNDSLYLFISYIKYPRTYHAIWSEDKDDDDRTIENMNNFIGKRVIITEKIDGENSSLYQDYIHARSINSGNHLSRNWVKQFWAKISGDIPDGWRICGENMYAVHSIKYDNLKSYFYGFSIWNDRNECLSWDETMEWFSLLGITPVEVLYDGIYDEEKIKSIKIDTQKQEGYVIRLAEKFTYGNFKNSVVKYRRANHVKTTKHWMHGQPVVKNLLGEL
jgi:hypothetical protein